MPRFRRGQSEGIIQEGSVVEGPELPRQGAGQPSTQVEHDGPDPSLLCRDSEEPRDFVGPGPQGEYLVAWAPDAQGRSSTGLSVPKGKGLRNAHELRGCRSLLVDFSPQVRT